MLIRSLKSVKSVKLAGCFLIANIAVAGAGCSNGAEPIKESALHPIPSISIEAAAQKVLDQAGKLYGNTAQWSGQIAEVPSFSEEVSKISVDYVRPDFIRIENRQGKDTVFEMADGKTVSSYIQSAELGSHSTRKVQLRTLSEILGESIASPQATGLYLANFLKKKSVVPKSGAQFKAENLGSLGVKLLTTAAWKGQTCDRVLIEKHCKKPAKTKSGEETWDVKEWSRDELWFTREGQLVKVLATEKYANESVGTRKGEITTQNFAPKFKPSIFQFTPPKEKMPKM